MSGGKRRLLVGEERDGQITSGRDPRRLQGFDHFESGKHAKVAVIAAAGADRVDVRTGHHRRAIAFAIHHPDHVADPVDRDFKPEVTHPRHDEVAAGSVLVGECEPGAPMGSLDRSDLSQRRKTIDQTVDVDAELGRRCGGTCHGPVKLTNCQSHENSRGQRRHPRRVPG